MGSERDTETQRLLTVEACYRTFKGCLQLALQAQGRSLIVAPRVCSASCKPQSLSKS